MAHANINALLEQMRGEPRAVTRGVRGDARLETPAFAAACIARLI